MKARPRICSCRLEPPRAGSPAKGAGNPAKDINNAPSRVRTVGYGNLVPAANPGQTFAVLEAVTGQLFLVVAVGKIISSMRRRGERPGS